MNFDVNDRLILRVKHGSHAYGLNTPSSDLDIKGICIEPKEYYLGFLHKFEQVEKMAHKGYDHDEVIFSLQKFMHLAAECNPNIIEILHVDESDVLFQDAWGQELRDMRDDFISRKARHTFSGYAHAQLKRIKTHRAWLLSPPKSPPSRKDYGLSEQIKISKSKLGAFEALVGDGVIDDKAPDHVTELYIKERTYQSAKQHWEQYQNWKKTRNPARAALEEKFGLDTKHAMHLIRLMRMCKEIMLTGKVFVKRPDRDELLSIRNGAWEYDRIVSYAEELDAECAELYDVSDLPHEPQRELIDARCVEMITSYLRHKP